MPSEVRHNKCHSCKSAWRGCGGATGLHAEYQYRCPGDFTRSGFINRYQKGGEKNNNDKAWRGGCLVMTRSCSGDICDGKRNKNPAATWQQT